MGCHASTLQFDKCKLWLHWLRVIYRAAGCKVGNDCAQQSAANAMGDSSQRIQALLQREKIQKFQTLLSLSV